MEASAVVGLKVRVGRRGAEVVEVVDEMIVEDRQWIMCLGVGVEALGHENDRAEIHGPSPKFGEQLALDGDVADVFRIRPWLDRRNLLVEQDGIAATGTDAEFLRATIEIARRDVPVLTFA